MNHITERLEALRTECAELIRNTPMKDHKIVSSLDCALEHIEDACEMSNAQEGGELPKFPDEETERELRDLFKRRSEALAGRDLFKNLIRHHEDKIDALCARFSALCEECPLQSACEGVDKDAQIDFLKSVNSALESAK